MVSLLHGGPDAFGVPLHDFSTNANTCGPYPEAVRALQDCDARHYPDPAYTQLAAQLAAWHGVEPERIVLAASASAFIQRISLAIALQRGPGARVWRPAHAYGDYARAAQAAGLLPTEVPGKADLLWACDPSSPLGQPDAALPSCVAALQARQTLVLDQAYEPLRLSGAPSLNEAEMEQVWRLITPNKALGLTGVRAAYAIAPANTPSDLLARVRALAPSWPLGAHGVALLHHWATPSCQDWLHHCRESLRAWKQEQLHVLQVSGWIVYASDANFFVAACACVSRGKSDFCSKDVLDGLRMRGIKLRDCTSFGLPGRVRIAVAPPPAQGALLAALRQVICPQRAGRQPASMR